MSLGPLGQILRAPHEALNISRLKNLDGVIQIVFIMSWHTVHSIPTDIARHIGRQVRDIPVGFSQEINRFPAGVIGNGTCPKNAHTGVAGGQLIDRKRGIDKVLVVLRLVRLLNR